MKLKYKYDYGNGREYSIAEAVCKRLSRTDYDSGELESLRYRVSAQEEIIAALVEILHSNGQLTDDQVLGICHVFERAE